MVVIANNLIITTVNIIQVMVWSELVNQTSLLNKFLTLSFKPIVNSIKVMPKLLKIVRLSSA